MKKIFLLFLFALFSDAVLAQQPLINTGIDLNDPSLTVTRNFKLGKQWKVGDGNKATHISYNVRDFGMGQIYIHNEKNELENKSPKKYVDNIKWTLSDKFNLSIIYKQVFSEERMNQIMDDSNEFSIFTNYKISTSGDLLEVAFILRMKTLITPFELEALEKAIKISFKVNITSSTEGGDFIIMNSSYRFSDALEGKQF